MGLETVTNIDDLVITNPLSTDARSQGDDHIRNIKIALKTDLPNITGAMTATQAELNVNAGVTAGTVTASKTVVVDASSKVDVWNVDNLVFNGNDISSTSADIDLSPTTNVTMPSDTAKFVMGAGDDASLNFDGTNLIILTDGAGASGIILDSEDDTFELKGSGVLQATFDTAGLNLVTGDAYYIAGTSVLNATTLGTAVVTSSLTTVGALGSGSISSGFGAIDIGSSALSTTGTITGPSGTWDVGGMDIATTDSYAIAGTDVLVATTLGTGVLTSSLTTVGALNSGSITSGFGAIDNGASAITTTGTITGGVVVADNININGNTIISTDTAGDINITPDTTGDLVLDGVKWPQADGSASQILTTDGAAQTSWETPVTTTALTTHGDILFRNASALARLGAGTSGQFLTSGGAGADVSWSTQAAADLSPVQTNIALLGFLRSTDHATSVLNMQNGYIDQFEDQTGVADADSTNELYNATDDSYGPVLTEADKTSTMTSHSAPSGTALASSELAGGTAPAWKAFNKTTGAAERWVTNEIAVSWLQYAFNNGLTAKTITSYSLNCFAATQAPKNFTLEASNTGSFGGEETVLDTQTSITFVSGVKQTFSFSNTTAYVYYRLDVTVNGGNAATAVDEFELIEASGPATNMTLIAEPQVALAAPDSAHVALFNQEVDTLTINTDILAWVSRSKQTFTATNATNVLNATAHLLIDTDRVMLISSGQDLPAGLDSETVYFVVSANANDFQVSLTSGGAAVTFSDDGTGTHSVLAVTACTLVDQGDFDTGKATLSGTVDISGQPSDTDMTLIVQTKNNKDTKLHGQALQYS